MEKCTKFCKNCSDIGCRCRHCKEHVYDVDCDIGWVSPAQLIMACRIYCKNCKDIEKCDAMDSSYYCNDLLKGGEYTGTYPHGNYKYMAIRVMDNVVMCSADTYEDVKEWVEFQHANEDLETYVIVENKEVCVPET